MKPLSVIIPVFNSAGYIAETLSCLYVALDAASVTDFEVLLVDDGSTDNLDFAIAQLNNKPNLSLISKKNEGRLRARIAGLELASFEHVLLLDSRVLLDRNALIQALPVFAKLNYPVLNAGVGYKGGLPLVSYFWEGLERMAWRNYYNYPRLVQLTEKNFDHLPKGTTALLLKKEPFLSISKDASESIRNDKHINDDTLIFRRLILKDSVYIYPDFRATYTPRSTIKEFLIHAVHRGGVALDGYFYEGTKPRRNLFLVFFSLMLLLISLPHLGLQLIFSLVLVFFILTFYLSRKVPSRARISNYVYGVPFLVAYSIGIVRRIIRRG